MGYIFSQIILITPPVLFHLFSEFVRIYKHLFFDNLFENNQHLFQVLLSFLQKFNKSVRCNKIRGKFPKSILSGNSKKGGMKRRRGKGFEIEPSVLKANN